MPINYDPLQEGDKLDAASLNDRFSEAGGAGQGVNNLSQSDLDRRAFRQEHLPDIITSSNFPNGLVKYYAPSAVSAPYTNRLNTYVFPNYLVPIPDYQTFDLSAPNGPYGPPSATSPGNRGWRIIADSNLTARAAEIEFGPLSATASNIGNYKGMLVKLGVEYSDFGTVMSNTPLEQLPAVAIAIGWEDNLGNRNIVERSIRLYNTFGEVKGSLNTFTFIKPDDIGDGNQINKVFGVIAAAGWGVALVPGIYPPIINNYNIDMIPIRSGEF